CPYRGEDRRPPRRTPPGPHHRRHHDESVGARPGRRDALRARRRAAGPRLPRRAAARRPGLPRARHPRGGAGVSARTDLPVAEPRAVRRYAVRVLARYPRQVWLGVALNGLAAAAALVAPRLLGRLVEAVEAGTTVAEVDRILLALAEIGRASCRERV